MDKNGNLRYNKSLCKSRNEKLGMFRSCKISFIMHAINRDRGD
jgi:hypothetical protein